MNPSRTKKVLLITYYWPPGGGAGVYRWLRMSQYFSEENIQLYVAHPVNASYPIVDAELTNQISPDIRQIPLPIVEPGSGVRKNLGAGSGVMSEKKMSIKDKTLLWIRGNFFIPDARMLWIRPSVKRLKKIIRKENIDLVISTGPPHSCHRIARRLQRKTSVKWIADFRDPWTGIDFYNDLGIGTIADKLQHRMEKQVLKEADEVITISNGLKNELSDIGQRQVHVITNGYPFSPPSEQTLDQNFTISHLGTMNSSRNPKELWEVLSNLCTTLPGFQNDLQIQLIGGVDTKVREHLEKAGLKAQTKILSTVPHHESIRIQESTQLLLLVVNNTGNTLGTLTGKFFEYLNAHRPILAIGPTQGDLAQALEQTKAGQIFEPTMESELSEFITVAYKNYQSNNLQVEANGLDQYSSQHLAKEFAQIIHRLTT